MLHAPLGPRTPGPRKPLQSPGGLGQVALAFGDLAHGSTKGESDLASVVLRAAQPVHLIHKHRNRAPLLPRTDAYAAAGDILIVGDQPAVTPFNGHGAPP